jgi:hypothetical protein
MTSPHVCFRKKPVLVQAVRTADVLRAAGGDWSELPEWLKAFYEAGNMLFLPGSVEILTLEGHMRAEAADWIIQGVKGEIYPCKPDIFEQTYERVVIAEGEVVP